jgi:hypothetical protein
MNSVSNTIEKYAYRCWRPLDPTWDGDYRVGTEYFRIWWARDANGSGEFGVVYTKIIKYK